ncbi:hypothetical protein PFISCL1PPCAC_2896, partial [Pristionchus fissidentatus]
MDRTRSTLSQHIHFGYGSYPTSISSSSLSPSDNFRLFSSVSIVSESSLKISSIVKLLLTGDGADKLSGGPVEMCAVPPEIAAGDGCSGSFTVSSGGVEVLGKLSGRLGGIGPPGSFITLSMNCSRDRFDAAIICSPLVE